MSSVAALCALLVGTFAVSQESEPTLRPYLMFFVRGEGQPPTGKELNAATQSHFANMRAQAEAGRLFAAGPVQDPAGIRRGITVVTVPTRVDVPALFTSDDFIRLDVMRIEAAPWDVKTGSFEPKVDPSSIVEHRLLLVRRGPGKSPETPEMVSQHEAAMARLARVKGPAVWGKVGTSEDAQFRGVLEAAIFVGTDSEGILAELERDTMFQRKLLEAELVPLWMSSGVVRGGGS